MRKTDVLFLLGVGGFALGLATLTWTRAVDVIRWHESTVTPTSPAAGEPRDVDMEKLRELLRAGKLSDREALYYEDADDAEPDQDRDR